MSQEEPSRTCDPDGLRLDSACHFISRSLRLVV